jgi:glycosyltransferase involved in cell wall biosynthesis
MGALAIGLVVPCRDEARVIERRLANLVCVSRAGGALRRVVVVDDHSSDGTAEVAQAFARREAAACDAAGVAIDVLANAHAPGKCNAIRTGLAHLAAHAIDLVGITDADVVCAEGALERIAAAFERDPRLGLACGEQLFVASLANDGSLRAADGGELVPAGGRYDRLTALVRRFESRSGRLFSVHGQLLVWRAADALAPRVGVAADDIDLMYEARARGRRVELVRGARFVEVKVPAGPDRDAQAMRRARAYFDALRPAGAFGSGAVDRAHEWCYRHLPRAAVWLAPLWLAFFVYATWRALDHVFGSPLSLYMGLGLAFVFVYLLRPLRDFAALLLVVERAARASRRERSTDRWEMARP